jgi:hypothetical protein
MLVSKLEMRKLLPALQWQMFVIRQWSWFSFASANLNATASQRKNSKGAALTLLGKAYLYQDKFKKAATTFDSAIGLQKYSLVADYNSIFMNLKVKTVLNQFWSTIHRCGRCWIWLSTM